MFRQRRRRSSFARRTPDLRWAVLGAGGIAVIALFLFFMRQADVLAPAPSEIRVELPDAFKD